MNHLLAVVCASVTGITLGIALHHKQSLAKPAISTVPTELASPQYYTLSNSSQHQPNPLPIAATHDGNNTHLENKLNQLLELQDTMRSQQSELNRELNAIQFRLDTHSASFRPLQTERNTETLRNNASSAPLTPLLPPRQ